MVRSHSEEESALLRADQVGTVVVRDEALTQAMTRHILQRFEADPASASAPAGKPAALRAAGFADSGLYRQRPHQPHRQLRVLAHVLARFPVRRFTAQPCKYDIWLTVLPVRLCIALP